MGSLLDLRDLQDEEFSSLSCRYVKIQNIQTKPANNGLLLANVGGGRRAGPIIEAELAGSLIELWFGYRGD